MITLVKWQTAKSITDGDNEYSYTYDENGIRTSKTVNGVSTYFNTSNGVILSQTDGTNTWYFQYDTNGIPLGFIYNGTQYFYMTNQMGDVIGLTKANGEVFAAYVYDEWGSLLSIQTIDSVSQEDLAAANSNPLRYRGYYYDTETGYYYLQSRYYDPSICRFINSDDANHANTQKEHIVGINIFAYSCNDPINNSDPDGHWVLSFGVEFEASAIFGVYGGLSINFDGKGNIVIAYCAGITFTTNVTASVYGYVSYNHRLSSATSIKGWGISVGCSFSSGVKLGGSGGLTLGLKDKSATGVSSLSLGAGVSLAPIPYISVRGGYTGIIYKTTFSKVSSRAKTYSKRGVKVKLSKKSNYVNIYIYALKRNVRIYRNGKISLLKKG